MHIRDNEFIRGEVPMTKEEIRMVSIGKLDLKKNSVLIDVGAGTGSIGIEGATYLEEGLVIGIERKAKGIELIEKNLEKFKIKNYRLIKGLAPEGLKDIEKNSFDRMFIGGSGGNLEAILDFFLEKAKEDSIFVINIIALETLVKFKEILERKKLKEVEVVQLSISRGKKVGTYTMMTGENPIYIISGRK